MFSYLAGAEEMMGGLTVKFQGWNLSGFDGARENTPAPMAELETLGTSVFKVQQSKSRACAGPSEQTSSMFETVSIADRIEPLDSMRGLAAVVVVFSHLWTTIRNTYDPAHLAASLGDFSLAKLTDPAFRFTYSPLRILTAGAPAVMFFFIVSGFSLSISWLKNARHSYWKFIVRRIFRIYPAFIVAWCIAFAIHGFVTSHGYDGGSIAAFWHVTSIREALTQLPLVLTQRMTIDPPAWSLTHEMRISLIFPLVSVLCLRIGPARSILMAAVMYSALWIVLRYEHGRHASDEFLSALYSISYLLYFMSGITIAELYFSKKLNRLIELNRLIRSSAWIVAISMMYPAWYRISTGIAQLAICLGGSTLIALTLTSECAATFLALRPIKWLGRVSYSLYLVHMPILYFTFVYFSDGSPSLTACLIATVVIALASEAVYRWVERPFIRLGRSLSKPRLRPA